MNKAPDKQRKALGRGLSALLPTKERTEPEPSASSAEPLPGVRVALHSDFANRTQSAATAHHVSIQAACRN